MREEIWKQLASRTFLVSSISSQRLRTKADRSIKIKIRRNSRFLAQFKVIDCKEETWERHDGGTKLFWARDIRIKRPCVDLLSVCFSIRCQNTCIVHLAL